MKYVIIRTENAGVFAGLLASLDTATRVAEVHEARRLWFWAGAASLSELAVRGTSKPGQCKFPVAVPAVTLLEVIEVLDVSAAARASIEAVRIWSA